jgi:hypothetical protein
MQETPPTAPAPQAPATSPAPPARPVTITIAGPNGTTQTLAVPLTRQDVRDLRARRSELSSQLTSAASRRHRLAEEIRSTTNPASRSGLEQRLSVLDARMIQLESDIAATGQQLSAAPQGLIASTEAPNTGDDMPDNVAAITGVFIIFVFFPIALAISRYIWKRSGKGPAQAPQLPAEAGQRLERLEQGMEAIAIEIERVSEGQRFVTRILSEGRAPERVGAPRD